MGEIHHLRREIRKKRRLVSNFEHVQSEQTCLSFLRKMPEFKFAKKIGIYLDAFGEIRTQKIIEFSFQNGKSVYLPMICNMNQQLAWVKISRQQYFNRRFSHHPLGMKEPMQSRGIHVSHLDLLIMPLLGCDNVGTRIGMGGGFYDRTLMSAPHQPFRLGLAHDFQFIEKKIYRQPWDQPVDALLTPTKLLRFKR